MAYTHGELSALKVPQLKALCKKWEIANYGKCTKLQLIEKLLEVQARDASPSAIVTTRVTPQVVPDKVEPLAASPTKKRRIDQPQDIATRHAAARAPADNPTRASSTPRVATAQDSATSHATLSATVQDLTPASSSPHASTPSRTVPGARAEETPLASSTLQVATTPQSGSTPYTLQDVDKSFIGNICRQTSSSRQSPISLLVLPDLSGPALSVAVRFWIARLYSAMQAGACFEWSVFGHEHGLLGPDIAAWPKITSCSKVTDEVYEVVTRHVGDDTTYLVLARSGEVIGKSEEGDSGGIREDWQQFIRKNAGLSSRVRTKDLDDYPGGISKAWTLRHCGTELLRIGERVVISNCHGASFTGPRLGVFQMEAEVLGHPMALVAGSQRGGDPEVALYLAERLQVSSVHLLPHPALAAVHYSSGFTAYVLRETGQTVGTEDEGITELWQGLLGSDARGRECDRDDFWSR